MSLLQQSPFTWPMVGACPGAPSASSLMTWLSQCTYLPNAITRLSAHERDRSDFSVGPQCPSYRLTGVGATTDFLKELMSKGETGT